jgi:DNA-directed RNA polymerase subunit N
MVKSTTTFKTRNLKENYDEEEEEQRIIKEQTGLSRPKRRKILPNIHPFPVECMTCYKRVGLYHTEYKKRLKIKQCKHKVMNDLGIDRECCRRMFLSHLDVLSHRPTVGDVYL